MTRVGELVKRYPEFQALDVQVLAVSVDPPDKARETEKQLKIPFPVLSDAKQVAMDTYGLHNPKQGPGGSDNNKPTRVLIDRTGTIRWIHQAENVPALSQVSMALEEAQKLK